MKKLLTGALVLIFITGIGAGVWYLQTKPVPSTALAVTDSTVPSDDLEITTPIIDGLSGGRKTIDAEIGGDITVRADDGTVFTLSIPAGALSLNREVQIAPFHTDTDNATLDRGIIVGPPGLSFAKPIRLIMYSPSNLLNPIVLKYSPLENQLTPQLIGAQNGITISASITSAGAYLISSNSSRGEALSRVTLSQRSPPPLSVLESARFLIKTGKQLSPQEMALVSRAINQLTALDQEQGGQSIDYKAILSGNPIGQPVPAQVPPLIRQQELDLTASVSDDPQASTLALAYSLHLIQTASITSTREALLQQKLQQQVAEKTVQQVTPDYDFPYDYTGALPLRGFDWAITGQQLLKLQFGINPNDANSLAGLVSTLEPLLKENSNIGLAYCSVYHALLVKNEVCNSFDSKVEVARTELWLAASDFDPASGPYESTATDEASQETVLY